MEIEVENDFNEEFYELVLPEVQDYYKGSQLSKRERYYHHYLNYGQHLYKNCTEAEKKLFGDIEVKDNFNEDLHEKRHPEVKEYMIYMGDWVAQLSKRKRYYHHYFNYCVPGCDTSSLKEIKEYTQNIRKKLIENQELYEKHKGSIVLVNHVSNPYGATHYLLSLFKLLKKEGVKVCLLDEIVNEKLYSKYQIDTKDVISYEQDLLFLCYIYEKIKPKVFYLNSIRGIFVDFINLKNPNVITHSHEIADVYGRYDLLPTYVVSKRIQKEFEDQCNHKPKIQPPIFLDETLELIDKEFNKKLPKVSNSKGDMDLSKITIGMCGQTETRKNPELFEAVSKLYPQYNFLWIGGEKGHFTDSHNLYHVPVVQFPFVYYKLIDYFILFSQEDPCPYVVLENLYVNNKVITFKDNIYTDHKCEQTKDIYFEFDGKVSLENLCKVIDHQVIEKTNRKGNGKKYVIDNFTSININCLIEDMEYFMVCHDQEIIIKHISDNNHNNFHYMFVGNKNSDKLNNTDNKITICHELPKNLEQYPNLCSFTAWYAISKNYFSKNKKICLLEYDVNLSDQFYAYHEKEVCNHIDDQTVVAYFYTLTDHYVFYKSTPYLEIALKKIYDIDLNSFVQKFKSQYPLWPNTTNMCMSKNTLDKFVDWFLPMTDLFKEDPLGSYVHERAFFIFCVINNIEIKYVKSPILSHNQQASHQNFDVYGKVLNMYKTTVLNQDMISDYDEIYEEAYRISLINCSK
jgi:hypothetical protein